ncbi:MAG: gliding motility-associated C-terminal domain-containing protein [Bacteroidales bacterium]|nr:gliding motility-associated C-terminal domain-containing protein [Bacteroidales bacterium]
MKNFIHILFILLPFILYAQQDGCNVTVSVDKELVNISSEPVTYTLTADMEADYYLWSTGQTGKTIEVELLPNTTKYVSVQARRFSEENLIENGDFEQGNVGFESDYIYEEDLEEWTLLMYGHYTITEDASQLKDVWDDCQNGGKFMLIDGTNIDAQAFWKYSLSVQPNTEYIFSFKAKALEELDLTEDPEKPETPKMMPPNIFIYINGKFVTSKQLFYNDCEWHEFNVLWESKKEKTMEIKLVDFNKLVGQNDFVLDDMMLKKVECNSKDTVRLRVKAPLVCEAHINVDTTTVIYSLEPYTFTLKSDDNADIFLWSTEQTGREIQVTVQPNETKEVILQTRTLDNFNMVYNGDFDLGDTGFESDLFFAGQHSFEKYNWYSVTDKASNIYDKFAPCTNTGGENALFMIGAPMQGPAFSVFRQYIDVDPGDHYLASFVCANETPIPAVDSSLLAKFRIRIDNQYVSPIFMVSNLECVWRRYKQQWDNDQNKQQVKFELILINPEEQSSTFALDEIALYKYCVQYDTVQLSVIYVEDTVYMDVCPEDFPVTFRGKEYKYPGEYRLESADTVYTLYISKLPSYDYTITASVEDGMIYKGYNFEESQQGIYVQNLESVDGCDSIVRLDLTVYKHLNVWLPDAFTPGRQPNDKFLYKIDAPEDFILEYFEIYNRWGRLVFSTDVFSQGWDGTFNSEPCPEGVYAYRLYYKYRYTGEKLYERHGSVMLFR